MIVLLIILSSCSEYMIAEGIGIYDPADFEGTILYADIPEELDLEHFVNNADVIAAVVIEGLTHAEVRMEEKDAYARKGIYANIRYTDVFYTWIKSESDGRDSNVYIDYTPLYANVNDPGFEEDGEYIIFLEKIDPDQPFVFYNFYNYYMMTDYRTYYLPKTPENETLIKTLITESGKNVGSD